MEQEQEQPQQQDPFQPFIDLYRRNPLQFSDRSAKYIQKYAAEHNIDLTPPVSPYELDPFKLANQAFSGFVSGFTALGDYADDTQNIWENLTNSLGHLFGFVGSLFALGGIGKGIVMGVTTDRKTSCRERV